MSILQNADMNLEAVAPSQAIVEQIAAIEGIDHTELVPLYEVIDPDALDTLVRTTRANNTPLHIEFPYHGHEVTVSSNGVVHIDEDVVFEG